MIKRRTLGLTKFFGGQVWNSSGTGTIFTARQHSLLCRALY